MRQNIHRSTSPPPRAAGRRERRRAETRERLYRAALRLFAERGFWKTTVEDITEAADVGKGTFFNYFPTKEHVLAAFGEERIAAVQGALDKARTGRGPVMEILKDLATDAAGQSKENAALLRAIYSAHASCGDVREELASRMMAARKLLGEIFSIAQGRGEVRRDVSAAEMARLTQIVFMGVAMAWAMNPGAPLRETADGVWGLVSPALRGKGAGGKRPFLGKKTSGNAKRRRAGTVES